MMTLTLCEFARRWLRQVPEKGHRVIRTLGLYHHAYRDRLEQCRADLGEQPKLEPEKRRPHKPRCPVCKAVLVEGREVAPLWAQESVFTGLPPPTLPVPP